MPHSSEMAITDGRGREHYPTHHGVQAPPPSPVSSASHQGVAAPPVSSTQSASQVQGRAPGDKATRTVRSLTMSDASGNTNAMAQRVGLSAPLAGNASLTSQPPVGLGVSSVTGPTSAMGYGNPAPIQRSGMAAQGPPQPMGQFSVPSTHASAAVSPPALQRQRSKSTIDTTDLRKSYTTPPASARRIGITAQGSPHRTGQSSRSSHMHGQPGEAQLTTSDPGPRRFSNAPNQTYMRVPSVAGGAYATAQTLRDVPELLAVQEFGFRRGQQDRDRGRNDGFVPANPFTPYLEHVWVTWYNLGFRSLAPLVQVPGASTSSSVEPGFQYDWAPLINVYTQTPENPNGVLDLAYVRKTCEQALYGMELMLKKVLERGFEWKNLVVDIPKQIQVACEQFPELEERYHRLKQAAVVAKAGDRPEGF